MDGADRVGVDCSGAGMQAEQAYSAVYLQMHIHCPVESNEC